MNELRKVPGTKAASILEKDRDVIGLATYIRFYPMVVEEAEGIIVKDADGFEYIDFLAGWAVANTGHRHPAVIDAIKRQIDKLPFTSFTSFSNEVVVRLAEKLIKITPGRFKKKVWFGHSGSDANDCVFKLVPLYAGRPRLVSFINSYHGQTMGSLSLSGHKAQSKFIGFPNVMKVPYPYCYRCPFNQKYPDCNLYCIDFIKDYIFKTICPPEDVAGLIVEPIQSDGGDIVPPDGFMPKLKKLCEDSGIIFIADEVKVGLGRTGRMFASEHWNIEPNVIVLGKPLASGMPLSACVTQAEILDSAMGAHLFTLSGHPVSCAAALATLDVIERENLIEKAGKMGSYMRRRFEEMKEMYSLIGDVRGKGLIIGVELVKDSSTKEPASVEAAKLCYRAWELGLLLGYVGVYSNVIEITPPLIITEKEADKGLDIFERALKEVVAGEVPDEKIKEYRGW